MEFITVTCNQCAAPLEVSKNSRFATCSFCQSRLEIHQSETAVFTEILDRLDQRSEMIGDDVSIIRKQNELAQLDREWQAHRDSNAVSAKSTSTVGSCLPILVLGVFAMLGIILLRIRPIFGLLWLTIVVFLAVQVVSSISGASQETVEEREYKRRREELVRDIQKD
jgi:cation transport ATPase